MATKVVVRPILGQANLLMDWVSSTLAAIAGTGGGKTILGYWFLASRMERYPGNTWLVAEPTYGMLGKILLTSSDPERPSLIEFFRQLGWEPDYHAVDKILHTSKGQIYLASADQPDSMQGAAVKGVWLDEPGQMRVLAYETGFQRRAMMEGQLLLTTTPYNLGWLKTEIVDKKDPSIHVERWRSIDRPGFPMESYEEARRRLPPWRFAMMFDAQFERPAGLIYSAFDERVCLIDPFPLSNKWLRYTGHDFGTANPACLFTAQDPATGQFYHYDEYLPGAGYSTAQHVEEFKKRTTGLTVLRRVGGSHGEDEIRQGYGAHGWVITEPKKSKVEAQIDAVIGMHQLNKIYVFKTMRHYLDEKRSFARKLDEKFQPLEEIENESRFHMMACERYEMSEFVPETVYSGALPKAVSNH